MLVLSCSRGGRSSLSLGMLLSGERGMLLLMLSLMLLMLGRMMLLVLLVLQPGGIGLGVLVLVRKDVLRLSLEHGELSGHRDGRSCHSGRSDQRMAGMKKQSVLIRYYQKRNLTTKNQIFKSW